MAPKQQLEKAAWEWAERTQPDDVSHENVETAYRIKLKPCELNLCRCVNWSLLHVLYFTHAIYLQMSCSLQPPAIPPSPVLCIVKSVTDIGF